MDRPLWLLRISALTVALVLVVGACGGGSTPVAPAFVGPTPTQTEEPLATEAPTDTAAPSASPKATPEPTAKPVKTPKPTKKPAAFYKPPGWDGSSDVDCGDFDTHAHAQSFFKGTGGTKTNDPYRLDSDSDGLACESLP